MRFCALHKVVAVFTLSIALGALSPGRSLAQSTPLPPEVSEMISQVKILGLTTNNQLVQFGSFARPIQVTGVDGRLVGIDFRAGAVDPTKRVLYGLSDTNKIYIINPSTGQAKLIAQLSVPFDSGFQSGMDFNPQADRLRLIGNNGRNFSVNVDPDPNGMAVVTPQTPLAYATGDRNVGKSANVTGGAYINNFPGTTATTLYDIDYDLDVLTTQTPPANGQLQTIGSLGYNLSPIAGFDIFTDAKQRNFGFTVSGKTLFYIDLTSGRATAVGDFFRSFSSELVGLAILPG